MYVNCRESAVGARRMLCVYDVQIAEHYCTSTVVGKDVISRLR